VIEFFFSLFGPLYLCEGVLLDVSTPAVICRTQGVDIVVEGTPMRPLAVLRVMPPTVDELDADLIGRDGFER